MPQKPIKGAITQRKTSEAQYHQNYEQAQPIPGAQTDPGKYPAGGGSTPAPIGGQVAPPGKHKGGKGNKY